ncbi:hypothetical protein F0U44_03730 [Nocardioides humilatus]|uniref:Copper chaperone PCu(A)C n=1 Tax=Nocardioides humilatus TaxID=2607660 RepID=A0A5B1LLT3_9ACTN|nr:hypothetical protein [Nocardioides humilatus]KAA1421416.1 hypothetical protein F0U44_03730 [Nocardioides humilatus]
MHHRRSTATALAAVLLPLAATLTSCGFDAPTDRVNTIAAGVNNREGSVDVLGARVVAWADGQGRLIGALAYNDNDATKPATLTGVTGEGITAVVPQGIEVDPGKGLNLASDDVAPIAVEGDFAAGEVITVTLAFSTDETASVDTPVVKPCRQYSDILAPDFAAEAGEESEAPEAEESEAPAEESETDDTYLCDHPTVAVEGHE